MSTETNHARDNAQAWAQTIADMVAALETCEDCEQAEAAQEAIQEAPLSVEVRSGWYCPGMVAEPVEYQILLSTGGPALRITGQLGAHGEAVTAYMVYQDWGTSWTLYHPAHGEPLFDSHNSDVLTFAQQFYFAE
jgi:hypothetical protein